jgi:hypothetical protein
MGVAVALDRPDVPVAPGTESASEIRIRNTGAIVDQFQLDVVGEAAPWAHVEPPQVNLMPGEEGTARLVFAPPRSSRVAAGPVAFALRVMSREDTAGSSIEEGVVSVAPYSQIVVDLVPRTSYGRFAGRHQLALDNLGNHPELVSVTASDPDRLLKLRVEPSNLSVDPGTTTFVKIKGKPKKWLWMGQGKATPFSVLVTGEESEQSTAQGAVLQQPLLPASTLRALAFLVAVAIALTALWFAFLKPTVESTAKAVAEDHTKDLVAAVEEGNALAEEANEQSAQASKDAAAAQKATQQNTTVIKDVKELKKVVSGGGSAAGAGTLSARATDFRITTSVPTGAGFEEFFFDVPDKKVLWISDIVLQNPAGDVGTLRIRRSGDVLIEFGLENFRDLDYHLIQPIRFADTDDVVVAVNCRNSAGDCTPSVYFTGRMTDEPKPQP